MVLMTEKEIAEEKWIPYFENLGFPKSLISAYGKVPVKFGTATKWADLVVYYIENDRAVPYAVIEIKQELGKVDEALSQFNETLSQAESYAKFLDAPFFAIADKHNICFYQKSAGGNRMRIDRLPVPDKPHLAPSERTKYKSGTAASLSEPVEGSLYSEEFRGAVDRFFDLIKKDVYVIGRNGKYDLRTDTIEHYVCAKMSKLIIQVSLKRIGDEDDVAIKEFLDETFKWYFDRYFMCARRVNIENALNDIETNSSKFIKFLERLIDFESDPEGTLEDLLKVNGDSHIKGFGIFAISQFLSGTNPAKYVVVEDRMVDRMKKLGLIDVAVDPETAKGYLYINEVCRQIKRDVFDRKISEVEKDLGFPVDEDFGMPAIHNFFWEFDAFEGYDRSKLRMADGKQLEDSRRKEKYHLEGIRVATEEYDKFSKSAARILKIREAKEGENEEAQ